MTPQIKAPAAFERRPGLNHRKTLGTMKLPNVTTARKAIINPWPLSKAVESDDPAIRYILGRFDVSPSLARTIASLAMLGARL